MCFIHPRFPGIGDGQVKSFCIRGHSTSDLARNLFLVPSCPLLEIHKPIAAFAGRVEALKNFPFRERGAELVRRRHHQIPASKRERRGVTNFHVRASPFVDGWQLSVGSRHERPHARGSLPKLRRTRRPVVREPRSTRAPKRGWLGALDAKTLALGRNPRPQAKRNRAAAHQKEDEQSSLRAPG